MIKHLNVEIMFILGAIITVIIAIVAVLGKDCKKSEYNGIII